MRRDTSLEKLGALKPAFRADGVVTAGNASQISDGAAALLVMERGLAEKMGLRPARALRRFRACGRGSGADVDRADPRDEEATRAQPVCRLDEIDLIEINEAFASVVLAWQRELGADSRA